MADYRGKVVVVTGASMGIGEAFARQLAAQGADVVLTARSAERLEALAASLRAQHGVRALPIALDLAAPGAPAALAAQIAQAGWGVDVLINNAGFGAYGRFGEVALAQQSGEIALNVVALVELTHLLMSDIVARRGGVINVASTAAFQPVPYMAVYGATKAFVLSFSESLAVEYRAQGVQVLALCPGATETPFFDRMGTREVAVGAMATPDQVAALGLRALARGEMTRVHGLANLLLVSLARFVPRALVARISGAMLAPRQALPA